MFKDALGREWQLATIQLDFVMPERFKLTYKDKEGTEQTPVMIHRAVAGSLERFMGVMIEHFAGAFPTWLSPVQVWIMPIGENHKEYAQKVFEKLQENNVRAELHNEDESLGKKIREAKINKVPYFLVIGDEEVSSKTVMVESRDGGKVGTKTVDEFIERIQKEL